MKKTIIIYCRIIFIISIIFISFLRNGDCYCQVNPLKVRPIEDIDPPVIDMSESIDVNFTTIPLYVPATPNTSYSFPFSGGNFSFAISNNPYEGGTSNPARELVSALNNTLRLHGWDSLMTITAASTSSTQYWWNIEGNISMSNSSISRQIIIYFSNSQDSNPNTFLTISVAGTPNLPMEVSPPLDTIHKGLIHLYEPQLSLGQESSLGANWIKKIKYVSGAESMGNTLVPTDSIVDISYYNSLGYPEQVISVGAGVNSGRNIIQLITYDQLGRNLNEYIPYISATNSSISSEPDALVAQNSYYQTLYGQAERAPFTTKLYKGGEKIESKVYGVGSIFLNDEKPIYILSLVALPSDSIPRLFYNDSLFDQVGGVQNEGYYTVNSIIKQITINEDGRITSNFIDSQGRLLLQREYVYDLSIFSTIFNDPTFANLTTEQKRKIVPLDKIISIIDATTTQRSDIVYVRDIYGRLRMVISPMGEKERDKYSSIISSNSDWAKKWCYIYKFEGENLTYKRLPGREEELMIFDLGGRVVAYQDGVLRKYGEWKLIQYGISELVVAEYLTRSYNKEQLQSLFSQPISYTDKNIPPYNDVSNLLLSKRLYYNIEEGASKTIDSLNSRFHLTAPIYDTTYRTKQLYVKELQLDYIKKWRENNTLSVNDDKYRHTILYYDQFNRLLETQKLYPDGNVLIDKYSYNYQDDIIKREAILSISGINRVDSIGLGLDRYVQNPSEKIKVFYSIEESYDRDKRGRLLQNSVIFTKTIAIDGEYDEIQIRLPSMQNVITYNYDDLGRRTAYSIKQQDTLFSPTIVQNYSYNIQDWQTSSLSEHRVSDGDNQLIVPIYSQELRYYDPIKTATIPLYSGGISEWTQKQGQFPSSLLSFLYDSRGFLIDSDRYLVNDDTPLSTDKYTEKNISYDENGNTIFLNRFEQSTLPQELSFQYQGNKMISVNGDHNTLFSYDENGNMVLDGLEGTITEYDINNLPSVIKEHSSLDTLAEFIFFSNGDKFEVKEKYSSNYNDLKVRKYYGPFTTIMIDDTTFIFESAMIESGELVIINNSTNNAEIRLHDHQPFTTLILHRDHLGSVRVVSDLDGNILERNDYFPFGLRTDRGENYPTLSHSSPTLSSPNLLFNGKEKQLLRSNYLDYGARSYNPITIRWTTQDPMAEKYYRYSPYTYCVNNPVNMIDYYGRETHVAQEKNGTYKVIGGVLNEDRNIYLYTKDNNGKYTIRVRSIGISTSTTSFYNADKNDGEGAWAINSIIDPNDKSGEFFLGDIFAKTPSMIEEYIKNAYNNKKYDFKVTNGTNAPIPKINIYRGMPIGKTDDGQIIFSSARDIGNIAAGYVAGANGIPWFAARLAFDAYQTKVSRSKERTSNKWWYPESISSQNAQYYGWQMGSDIKNNTPTQKFYNLLKSIWDWISK